MSYQQFSFAFVIPANAWTRPGPETTKQTAGLKIIFKIFFWNLHITLGHLKTTDYSKFTPL